MFADVHADIHAPLKGLPLDVVAVRMCAALLFGGLIGWERESSHRAAGLRTHMLIALAAVLFTITALELTYLGDESGVTLISDPLRLIEAVTSGVAFLAAGSIFMSGGSVCGVTTGASMWLAGAIGLACGTGNLQLAALATGLALVVLWLMRVLVRSTGQDDLPKDEPAQKDGD
ncbi:MAG: MgtC/SapB family protein [Paracoccus sp. (in: a-proteobacteria)]|uniref:MgtC/SapB family protein n=1 Tax=Paracoccus sp. TaxID=267 RepID=UPI0026DFE5C7|nr:MgtC/SapB family protein [Paracoccus sp. (in: a-proteobacteria)]MDO5622316.1 MgtC/SapB family protein [Paracoccus sp. (in: a-proteobacteria)]